jgi:hypothetical protein
LLLIETVTVTEAAAARVPLVGETLIQVRLSEAVQNSELPPVFVRVYALLVGLNGPPCVPDDVRPVAGVTERTPPGAEGVAEAIAPEEMFPGLSVAQTL